MNDANFSLAEKEITKQLGHFPAFLIPAVNTLSIYRSLTQKTLLAYINNPLPAVFKEQLFVVLSRYCGIEYFTICHSCTLYSLGMPAAEILELGNLQYPQTEPEAIAELEKLKQPGQDLDWQDNPQTATNLLHCASFIFFQPQAADFSKRLKQLLGTVRYHYLVVLLGYIALCHQWVKSNPTISHCQDRRSQLYLGSLLLENTELAQFFQTGSASPTSNLSQLASNNGSSTTKTLAGDKDPLTVAIPRKTTDIVRENTKLAEVKAKLRLTLEATNTGQWNWDLITNKIVLCHRSRAILGLSDFNGSHTDFLQAIHPEEREAIDLEAARAVQNHQDLDLKFRVIRPDRQVVWIRTKGKLNYNCQGKPVRISGILTAISAPELRQENPIIADEPDTPQTVTRLEAIADLLPYYLLAIEVKTKKILLLNSKLAKSLAISRDEAVGKSCYECCYSEYAERIGWLHQQVVSRDRTLHIQEEITLPDGIHYFDTVVVPLQNTRGVIYATLHISSDIPDLAAIQEALSQRKIQLEAANRELESFSYSVSHDLQAPLRVINGFSQVLWEYYESRLDERGKHYLQRIQGNSQRMSDSIDALLELSRVTRSHMKSVRVNLSAIALDIVEELKLEHPQRQVEVTITPNLETTGDPQLLRIVLSNLLDNAWKYTSGRSLAKIEFGSLALDERQTIYYVKDNGAGFNVEYADKLFTAFQRLHSEAEFPGTGIGLATVQRIIYRHGGKVWAEGECDRGATIYFSL